MHNGGVYGFRSGEGPSAGAVPVHRVRIHDRAHDETFEVDVPEDRCGVEGHFFLTLRHSPCSLDLQSKPTV